MGWFWERRKGTTGCISEGKLTDKKIKLKEDK